MTKTTKPNDELKLIKSVLNDEQLIDALARRISLKLRELATKPSDPVALWQDQLDTIDMDIDENCSAEQLAKLFPLSSDEIERVGNRIRTGKLKGSLSLESMREQVLDQLGDDSLMAKTASTQPAQEKCGNTYDCGYPYHCGHEVHCGTPYEFVPCGNLYEYYCRPQKDCPVEYYTAKQASQKAPTQQKSCNDPYECGQPYHCGHEVNCGMPYELIPCGHLYDYACAPLKDCSAIYYKKRS